MKKDNRFRKIQRALRDQARSARSKFEDSGLRQVATDAGDAATTAFKTVYTKAHVDEAVKPIVKLGSEAADYTRTKAEELDQNYQIREKSRAFKRSVADNIAEPTKKLYHDSGMIDVVADAGRVTGDVYGSARSYIKPYFEPEDARELLENTRKELTYITACMLQVSYKEAEGWLGEFSKLASAKVAGAAGAATLFGLVSTFGTASTGTAIASLSGAAANSATLASIGSVVGGGMAAGALVMSGVGVVLGIGAYQLMKSTARQYETLPDEDRRIVDTAGTLLTAIQEKLGQPDIYLTAEEAEDFLDTALIPFHEYLHTHADRVCSRLDNKNAIAYRQHVLKDFEPVVIEGFRYYIELAPAKPRAIDAEALIGGVFYALLSRSALDGSFEEALVLDALRRSSSALKGASEEEIADYLRSLSPEQLKGLANNIKGIYHELRWVERYNATHEDTYAVMHESPTHEGSDVQIFSKEDGVLVDEFQLKATDSSSYVREHMERYPETDALATSEVSDMVDGVGSSGFSNEELTETVDHVFDSVASNTILDRATESGELAGLIRAGREALDVMNGQASISGASKRTVGSIINAAAATGITAFLFS